MDPPGMFLLAARGWGPGDVRVGREAGEPSGCAAMSPCGVSLDEGGWASLQLRHLV